jgi:hypothetical protein
MAFQSSDRRLDRRARVRWGILATWAAVFAISAGCWNLAANLIVSF